MVKCNVYRQEFNWLYTSPEGGGSSVDHRLIKVNQGWSTVGHRLVKVGHRLVIGWSSVDHRLVIGWSSVDHRLVIGWSSVGHRLIIGWSSVGHRLVKVGHRLVIGWSSVGQGWSSVDHRLVTFSFYYEQRNAMGTFLKAFVHFMTFKTSTQRNIWILMGTLSLIGLM